MEACQCTAGSIWASNSISAELQFFSDMLISLAYLLIPLELAFLARESSSLAPYCTVMLQFGAFIILCSATDFLNLWAFSCSTDIIDTIQAVTKVLCAIFSCATAVSLIGMIHRFLRLQT